jgi:Flp pilus assembly protein TadG
MRRMMPARFRGSRTRGQSLVEFALVLPILMLLLLGAIQFGVIWATQVGVTNAVRDAARAASGVQPKADAATGTVDSTTESTFASWIKTNVLLPGLSKNVPFYGGTNLQLSKVCYTSFTDAASGTSLEASVTVTYAHPIFIPLIASVLGTSGLAATASLSIPVGLDQPFSIPPSGTSSGTPGC